VRALPALLSAAVGGLAVYAGASAQPSVPATFYGSVTVDGAPAEAGLEVRGFVAGLDCTQSAPGERLIIRDGATAAYVLYVVHDTQRPGCAREGSTVTFTIGGRAAVQGATWRPGPIRLDLSTGGAPPIPLPSPTGTIASAINTATGGTPVPGSPTALSRPTGTPPTDDVRLPGTGTGTGGATPQPPASGSEDDDSSGGNSGLLIAGVLALSVLALAGGAIGFALSRRPRMNREA